MSIICYGSTTVVNVDDGSDGVGISQIEREYFLSTSSSELINNAYLANENDEYLITDSGEYIITNNLQSWQDTEPEIDSDSEERQYIWTRWKTTMDDGSITYSTEKCESSLSGVYFKVDQTSKTIASKAWRSDITQYISDYDGSTTSLIRDRLTLVEQDMEEYSITVADIVSDVGDVETRMTAAEANITLNAGKITAMVSVDGQTSAITLTQNMLQAITNQFVIKDSTGTSTIISGGVIQAGVIPENVSDLQNDSGFITSTTAASTYAAKSDAVSEEQYIYISKTSGTTSVSANTAWITDVTGSQNTWTTKRPEYNSSYPILFIAKQKKTVSGTITCTTPIRDDTLTTIDGGHITTGTIDASQVNVTNINASSITIGTLDGSLIGTSSIALGKLATEVATRAYLDSVEASLQGQIDGQIETWTGSAVPTLSNYPASSWTDATTKDKHVGDIYYVVNDQNEADGYCYRFQLANNVYSWRLIKDNQITKALQDIIDIQGDIDDIDEFNSTVSGYMTSNDEELVSIKANYTSLSSAVSGKVDSTTFNSLSQDVSGNSLAISNITSRMGLSSDGTAGVNDVVVKISSLDQDLDGFKTTVSNTYATQTALTTEANIRKAVYGLCSTEGSTAAKVVTCANFALYSGVAIKIGFSNANTTSNPTLNVNSTGAIAIKSNSGSNLLQSEYKWSAGSILDFVYDGTYWRLVDGGLTSRISSAESSIIQNANDITLKVSETDVTGNYLVSKINLNSTTATIEAARVDIAGAALFTSGRLSTSSLNSTYDAYGSASTVQENLTTEINQRQAVYGVCASGISNQTKSVNILNFSLYTGAVISVLFQNNNTNSEPQLKINDLSAITIKSSKGEPLTTDEYSWASGSTISFVYDGTYWRMLDSIAMQAKADAKDAIESLGGYTILWNYGSFTSANSGRAYICALDQTTGTTSNDDGWVKWNGTKRTITKGVAVPGTVVPYNTPIYIVCRLSSSSSTSGTNYMVWYDKSLSTPAWNYSVMSPSVVAGTWTWGNNTDIILGKFVEPSSNGQLTECEIYNPPWTSKQITTDTTTAGSSVSEEQYIYKQSVAGTTSILGTTTWVTSTAESTTSDTEGLTPIWTTKRPIYRTYYPVLWIAKQKKTMSGAVTCTTPTRDDTTTIIDGGHISTGSIDANLITSGEISSTVITAGSLGGISFGGTNLLKNSNDLTKWTKESGVTVEYDSTTDMYKITDTTHTSSYYGIYQDVIVNPETTYTASVEMLSGSKQLELGIQSYQSGSVSYPSATRASSTTKKSKYSYTITTGANHTIIRFYLFIRPTETNLYGFACRAKLELGDFATDWDENPSAIYDAAKTATNYIEADSNGIKVHNAGDLTDYLGITSSAIDIRRNNVSKMYLTDSELRIGELGSSKRNVYISGSALQIRNNETVMAEYGSNITMYKPGTSDAILTISSADIRIGESTSFAKVNSDGLDVIKSSVSRAFFGTTCRIGVVDTNKRNVYITDSAVQIRNNTNVLAEYGSSIFMYQPGTNTLAFSVNGSDVRIGDASNYAKVDSSGLDIYKSSVSRAFFGTVSRIGKAYVANANDNEAHIEFDYHSFNMIDKDGESFFEVKDLRDSSGVALLTDTFSGDPSNAQCFLTAVATNTDYSVRVTVYTNSTETDVTEDYPLSSKTRNSFTFATAPPAGYTITANYYSNSDVIKSYTLGSRLSGATVGPMSVVSGTQCKATAVSSTAKGHYTKATGKYSNAEGIESESRGEASHAEGSNTAAMERSSHAEGGRTVASGSYSHAEGYNTTASGYGSHAEGSSTASNTRSHAEGSSIASGPDSHSEGYSTASGNYSHSEGYSTKASGNYSHAGGYNTNAKANYQTAIGMYNADNSNALFIVGNGDSEQYKSNALTVYSDGSIRVYGSVYASCNDDGTGGYRYAGGTEVTLNGSSKAGSTASFYAPTSAGTSNYLLQSNGSGAPSWTSSPSVSSLSVTSTSGSAVNISGGNFHTNDGTRGAAYMKNGIWSDAYGSVGGRSLVSINNSTNKGTFYGTIDSGSDLRYKSVINDYDWKVDEFISGLKPIAYHYIRDNGDLGDRIHFGFGAQDIKMLMSELNMGDLSIPMATYLDEKGNDLQDVPVDTDYSKAGLYDKNVRWGLNYLDFIAPMVLEIQRLMKRVDELEKKVGDLSA